MKQVKTLLSVLMLFAVVAPAVHAEGAKKAAAHAKWSRPYGMAGCGLGSIVIGKSGGQISAATTNGSSGTQIFGITSGTSNCIDSTENEVAHRMDYFILANKGSVASDVARGHGETLSSLATLMGCNDHSELLGSSLQKNFGTIFPSAQVQPNEVTDAIINLIKTDDSLTGKCSRIS